MKRLPIIVLTLALCLLTAGCGAKPNEPDAPLTKIPVMFGISFKASRVRAYATS